MPNPVGGNGIIGICGEQYWVPVINQSLHTVVHGRLVLVLYPKSVDNNDIIRTYGFERVLEPYGIIIAE